MNESPQTLTKREVMDLLGFRYESEIAEVFKITKGAVSHWGRLDDPIPRSRYLELRYEIRPDLFAATSADNIAS